MYIIYRCIYILNWIEEYKESNMAGWQWYTMIKPGGLVKWTSSSHMTNYERAEAPPSLGPSQVVK